MTLYDLIRGNKTKITLPLATAKVAKVAKVEPRFARFATFAVAEPETTKTIPAVFEQTGDPVTCPYWQQVCHAVSFYQDACTRSTDCPIFKFLKLNS